MSNINFGYPKEIVAAQIGKSLITNDPKTIINQINNITDWLDRGRMQFMSNYDLGINWDKLANSSTLFLIHEDGSLSSPYINNNFVSQKTGDC